MTREELAEIVPLAAEISDIQRRLSEAEVQAVVQTSSKTFPYTKCTAIYEGYPPNCNKLVAELQHAKKQYSRCLEWIDGISDVLTRRIFRLRFVEGLSWRQIAQKVGGNNSEEGLKKIEQRFLAKM